MEGSRGATHEVSWAGEAREETGNQRIDSWKPRRVSKSASKSSKG